MRASRPSRLVLLLGCGLFLVLGAGVALVVPVDAGPDEPSVQQYAHYLCETGALPDPTEVDVVQAQHPPLYYAWLAAWLAATPGFDDGAAAAPARLPYERAVRVAFDQQHAAGALPARRALRAARGEMPATRHPHVLRLAGLLLGLGAAVLVFVGVRRAFPESGVEGTLAAAVAVLVPQFAVTFALPVNDQASILLGTAALALLAPREASTGLLLRAGLLFGLAFLSKILAVGPFLGGCVLAATAEWRGRRGGLPAVGLLALGPLLLAGWWYGRQWMLSGSPVGTAITAANHPAFIRSDPPDAWELLQLLGAQARAWLGVVGGVRGVTPGEHWMAVAAVLPVLVIAATVAAAGSRGDGRGGQAARIGSASLLAGAATVAVLLYGSRWFVVSEGRYLQGLVLPVAWGLAAGVPRLFGRAARPLLGGLAVLMALGGVLLLHVGLIPAHHATLDVAAVPGGVACLDLGTPRARDAIVAGRAQPYWGSRVADADRRMVVGPGETPRAFAVRLDGLAEEDLHLVSYRIFPPSPMNAGDLSGLAHVELAAGGRRLGGLFSSHLRAGRWIHGALPPGTVAGGRVVLEGRGRGHTVGLSQVAVRRLPFRVRRAFRLEDALVVETETLADGVASHFSLGWQGPGADAPRFQPLVADQRLYRFEGLEASARAVELVIQGPAVAVAELKAVLAASPAAYESGVLSAERDVVASLGSPGLFGLRLDAARHKGREVLRIAEHLLPRRDVTRLQFLDERARPVPDGCLQLVRDGAAVAVLRGRLDLDGTLADEGPWAFVDRGAHDPFVLDRIVAWAPVRWRIGIDLER